MRDINATGRLVSVELLPRDGESDIGGVRLETVLRAGVLGDAVEVRATVDSYCDDHSSRLWLRLGEVLREAGSEGPLVLCHVAGVVHRSVTDQDGVLHLGMVGHSISPDITVLGRFLNE
ncbi:hypothetical protein [Brachybacterium sp. p3-SID957]|uniref:hypothetical protein n=1 Tax=Brachybacterium sp. p3-SID957 TaxID=2916049 RepID=UPI00223B29A0|nr:hypothetical protein [Brachybacterium sp. p3-SID957]MCT1776917.1 hypothetical protein [Brachybacterium sp. p3-SID957]